MMIIKKRKALWLGLILLLALMGLGVVMADGTALSRSLVSGGGGIVSQSGVTLRSATGQPAAGAVENDLTLCSGYWCSGGAPLSEPPIIEDEFELFLPIIIK